MNESKKKTLEELIEIVNDLDYQSVLLLVNGANMLKAKEQLDRKRLEQKAG